MSRSRRHGSESCLAGCELLGTLTLKGRGLELVRVLATIAGARGASSGVLVRRSWRAELSASMDACFN